jgi:hypothetical protein
VSSASLPQPIQPVGHMGINDAASTPWMPHMLNPLLLRSLAEVEEMEA